MLVTSSAGSENRALGPDILIMLFAGELLPGFRSVGNWEFPSAKCCNKDRPDEEK